MTARCSTCGRPLVWPGDQLICPGVHRPGHQDLVASIPQTPRAQGATPATVLRDGSVAGDRALATDTSGGNVKKLHGKARTPRRSAARAGSEKAGNV